MFDFHGRSLGSAIALAAAVAFADARAANAPADPCSLLPAAAVSKAVGRDFGEPAKSVAPRPYRNTSQGTDCLYRAKGGRGSVLFRVYFDPSPSESAELFNRLKMMFGGGRSVPGVGDDTYFDSQHALHERKGNVRFYLSLDGTGATPPAKEKALTSLANAIGGRL